MQSHAHRKLQQVDTRALYKDAYYGHKNNTALPKRALIVQLRRIIAELESREVGRLLFTYDVEEVREV